MSSVFFSRMFFPVRFPFPIARYQLVATALACLIGTAIVTTAAEPTTLKEAAGNRVHIGCAIATVDLDKPKLVDLIVNQFECITPEYELMPQFMVDDKGKFTFERGDKVVNFAEEHHLPVFGQMLLWHFVTRDWLFKDAKGNPLPRAEALANLQKYIAGVVGHYKGRIKAWNVVNEGLSDKAGEYLRDTPAEKAIGEDYIIKAFQFAHEADPDAELYYNDYNIEQPDKRAKAIRLIRSLKAAHVRLDAIGIQGHWLMDYPPTSQIEEGIAAFAAEGLKVMITELDLDPLPRTVSGADLQNVQGGSDPYPNGLPADLQDKFTKRYGEIVAAILKNPSVTTITFWGTHDGRSWLNDFPVKGRTNYPLLFDRQLQPKPAFQTVIDALDAANKASK